MRDLEKKIAQIKAEIRRTPYHKGTEHYIGLLKAKLARLKNQALEKATRKGGGLGFAIPKEGDATCVLVGFPSVGKSTILSKLTAAKPKIAPYPFTTLSVIPGIMNYKGASIQILDVPGLVGGAARGIGRGREVLSVARASDLLIIICEAEKFNLQKTQIELELAENGIIINKAKPDVRVKKLASGGLKVITVPNFGLSKKQIISTASEFGLVNAEIQIKGKITQEDLIDTILANRVYLPAIYVASKVDLVPKSLTDGIISVSAVKNTGFSELKEKIWQTLGLIRVYLKPIGDKSDFNKPLILKYRSKVIDGALKISNQLASNLTSAEIIRNSFKKKVSLNFQLEEGDIVTLLTT